VPQNAAFAGKIDEGTVIASFGADTDVWRVRIIDYERQRHHPLRYADPGGGES
jgi:hypothetical protein